MFKTHTILYRNSYAFLCKVPTKKKEETHDFYSSSSSSITTAVLHLLLVYYSIKTRVSCSVLLEAGLYQARSPCLATYLILSYLQQQKGWIPRLTHHHDTLHKTFWGGGDSFDETKRCVLLRYNCNIPIFLYGLGRLAHQTRRISVRLPHTPESRYSYNQLYTTLVYK